MTKIHRKHLVAKGACEEGLAFFDEFKKEMGVPKNKVLIIEWDQLSMVWALSNPEYKTWARWAIDNAILPSWSLQGANLNGAKLEGANLRGANLECAYLRGAELYGANLEGANLTCADLTCADLNGANLNGANLTEANLDGVSLYCAYYPTGPVPDGWRRTETGYLTKA